MMEHHLCNVCSQCSGLKADVFSMGCIALEMLVSQVFFNENWVAVYEILKSGDTMKFGRSMKDALDFAQAEVKVRHAVVISSAL